ncbi:MAG: cobalt transporter CbiM [Candidatus Thiodiazotropha sp. (ex Monitilora ramsayi)]|nr:cobalt transporter CbiM [Candidatus Thiodiazotropha sp. (ex Monitilora ramsayi)]
MAHIPDGVLAAPVLIGGAVITVGALAVALHRLDTERIPQVAVLSAAFFISSLVSIPMGPGSVHLLMNGLMGLVLGWAAVPAILVALSLQAVFFGYGGFLVLGVNTMNIALPALVCGMFFSRWLQVTDVRRSFLLGALAGGLGVLLTGLMVVITIALSNTDYLPAAKVMIFTYLPLAVVEMVVAGAAISFIRRVAPELLFLPERQSV